MDALACEIYSFQTKVVLIVVKTVPVEEWLKSSLHIRADLTEIATNRWIERRKRAKRGDSSAEKKALFLLHSLAEGNTSRWKLFWKAPVSGTLRTRMSEEERTHRLFFSQQKPRDFRALAPGRAPSNLPLVSDRK